MRNPNNSVKALHKEVMEKDTEIETEKSKIKFIRTQLLSTLKTVNKKAGRLAEALINMETNSLPLEYILTDFKQSDFDTFRKIGWIELKKKYLPETGKFKFVYERTVFFERVFMS